MITNINIKNNNGYLFNYALEMTDNKLIKPSSTLGYLQLDTHHIILSNPDTNLQRVNNDFFDYAPIPESYSPIPSIDEQVSFSRIRLFWPTDAVDIYDKTSYALEIVMHICDQTISLGCFGLSRVDSALACSDGVQEMYGDKYYECTEVYIPSPSDIIYSDSWAAFRQLCGEVPGTNNESAQISFTLHPIERSSGEQDWIMKTGYTGGQNSINISKLIDYLNVNLSTNIGKVGYSGIPALIVESQYNPIYNSLDEYLQETYGGGESIPLMYEIVVMVGDEIAYVTRENSYVPLQFQSEITSADSWACRDLIFSDWNEYVDGMVARATLNILDPDDTSNIRFSICSNIFPITQEVFKYFTLGDHNVYNLDDIDMETHNITIINKTVKNVITYDHAEDSKSNIIQPVFFRVQELGFIVVHPMVTENICINLDVYKSKVDSFQLQLEGVSFVEIGRTAAGVIFKIQGSRLPKELTNGTYYITNENGEVITSGKYTYEY